MNFKISRVLAKDLIQERSRYVKDGQLIFNRVLINSHGANDCTIELYYDTCHLASIKADGCPGPFMKFDFQLNDSNMKLHFEDKDLCGKPDLGFRERIEAAIIEIREALNEEEEI